jgi:hypothetical protein
MNVLEHIQALQFTDKPGAEALLKDFIRLTFDLEVETVELRPLAVSLNSFNGFVTLTNRRRLFFKTHIEPNSIIGEYYNAETLAQAGYPVLQPVMRSTEAGKQFLIYEVIEDPSVFDIAWRIERGDDTAWTSLQTAQQRADDDLFALYVTTLEEQDAQSAANAPIHQLFYHRLMGGRMSAFYGDETHQVSIGLPDAEHAMGDVRRVQWIINEQRYDETLDDIIARAAVLLAPSQRGVSIIGHGDAHNGNVFLQHADTAPSLLYFDPAFAGRHHPLLDLTKPVFHNVFAMWMYFPREIDAELSIRLVIDGDVWHVTHDYALHRVRHMFLDSKIERVLIPILAHLKMRGQLRPDWRAFLKAALMCCPLLTMNLTDSAKFSPNIALLGLCMAVEMGSESMGVRSHIDQHLDAVERIISR